MLIRLKVDEASVQVHASTMPFERVVWQLMLDHDGFQ